MVVVIKKGFQEFEAKLTPEMEADIREKMASGETLKPLISETTSDGEKRSYFEYDDGAGGPKKILFVETGKGHDPDVHNHLFMTSSFLFRGYDGGKKCEIHESTLPIMNNTPEFEDFPEATTIASSNWNRDPYYDRGADNLVDGKNFFEGSRGIGLHCSDGVNRELIGHSIGIGMDPEKVSLLTYDIDPEEKNGNEIVAQRSDGSLAVFGRGQVKENPSVLESYKIRRYRDDKGVGIFFFEDYFPEKPGATTLELTESQRRDLLYLIRDFPERVRQAFIQGPQEACEKENMAQLEWLKEWAGEGQNGAKLVDALLESNDPLFWMLALDTARAFLDSDEILDLADLLLDDDDPIVRSVVIEYIVRHFGNAIDILDGTDFLIEHFIQESEVNVLGVYLGSAKGVNAAAFRYANVLEKLSLLSSIQGFLSRSVNVLRRIVLDHQDPAIREEALLALGAEGSDEARQIIEMALKSDEDFYVRLSALFTLNHLGETQPFLDYQSGKIGARLEMKDKRLHIIRKMLKMGGKTLSNAIKEMRVIPTFKLKENIWLQQDNWTKEESTLLREELLSLIPVTENPEDLATLLDYLLRSDGLHRSYQLDKDTIKSIKENKAVQKRLHQLAFSPQGRFASEARLILGYCGLPIHRN